MTTSECCINVGPVLPENWYGAIVMPDLVDRDFAPFTGNVAFVSSKPSNIRVEFTSIYDGAHKAQIPQNHCWFSQYECEMKWEARNRDTFEKLFFVIDDEYYDCLYVQFSPLDCDNPNGEITLNPIVSVCNPCEEKC